MQPSPLSGRWLLLVFFFFSKVQFAADGVRESNQEWGLIALLQLLVVERHKCRLAPIRLKAGKTGPQNNHAVGWKQAERTWSAPRICCAICFL